MPKDYQTELHRPRRKVALEPFVHDDRPGAELHIVAALHDNGYQRLVDLVPNHWGTLKTWQSRNILSLDYDLIDFGRRDAASTAALNQLVAANLLFNRKVQEVVFNVERSFYELDAARAGVEAADTTVKLATTDRRATELRQKHGLSTAPELLLARQREAQADFDLENARLAVSLAQADLAVALGLRADDAPEVASLKDQPLPQSLGANIERLIDFAVRQRPDLAAMVSTVRAVYMPGLIRERKVSRKFASTYQLRSSTRLTTCLPSLAYWPTAILRLVT